MTLAFALHRRVGHKQDLIRFELLDLLDRVIIQLTCAPESSHIEPPYRKQGKDVFPSQPGVSFPDVVPLSGCSNSAPVSPGRDIASFGAQLAQPIGYPYARNRGKRTKGMTCGAARGARWKMVWYSCTRSRSQTVRGRQRGKGKGAG